MSDLLWIVGAAVIVVGGTCLNGFFRNFWDQRRRRKIKRLEWTVDYKQGLLDKYQEQLHRGALDIERARKLARLIEVHREQVELIERGLTPEGFTPGGDLYNQADKQLYAGYALVMEQALAAEVPRVDHGNMPAPEPPTVSVVWASPAPPIPPASEEEPPHAR